jgi:hypothetical protein
VWLWGSGKNSRRAPAATGFMEGRMITRLETGLVLLVIALLILLITAYVLARAGGLAPV